MYDPELEGAVAKMRKSDEPMSKSDQYLQLKKFSNRQRAPTESVEKAFTRFITTDPDGKALYKAYTQSRGVSVPFAKTGNDADGDNDASNGETTHMQTLREIASKIQQKHPELGLTKSSAMSLALTTEAGKQAYEADKLARMRRVA